MLRYLKAHKVIIIISLVVMILVLTATNDAILAKLPALNRARFKAFLLASQLLGWTPIITSGVRSQAEQTVLHKQNSKNAKTVGTHDGRALDLNFIKGEIHLKKATEKSVWLASGLITLAKLFGISWGGEIFKTYYDPVHFQL